MVSLVEWLTVSVRVFALLLAIDTATAATMVTVAVLVLILNVIVVIITMEWLSSVTSIYGRQRATTGFWWCCAPRAGLATDR